MREIDSHWRAEFDAAMKHYFAIDSNAIGLDEADLERYADLPPQQAVLQFGEDYEVQRVDIDWLR